MVTRVKGIYEPGTLFPALHNFLTGTGIPCAHDKSRKLFPLRAWHQAGFDEAAVPFLPGDQMIQDPKVDGAGGLHQGPGEVPILRGGLGVPAGVVVDEDDARSS